jgi:multiple sugar transport system substrate-binding protein
MPRVFSTRRQVIGAAPLALAAAACSTGEQAASTSPARQPVTLGFHTNWNSGARLELIQKAVPEFQRQNPNVTVDLATSGAGSAAFITAAAAAGTLQEVVLGASGFFHEAVRRGYLHDITPVLKQLRVNINDYSVVAGASDLDGKRYGMPFQFTCSTWHYNRTMFEREGIKPPTNDWTWNDLLNAARALTKPTQKQWGLIAINDVDAFWGPLVLSNSDRHWVTDDYKKTLLDRPEAIEAFQYAFDFIHRHRVAPSLQEQQELGSGDPFISQNVAMKPRNSAFIGTLNEPNRTPFTWDLFHLPYSPRTRKRRATMADQPHWVTFTAKEKVEEATRFVAFMAGEYTQELIADLRGATPAYKKVQTGARYLAAPPASMKVISESLAYAVDRKTHARYGDWETAVRKGLDAGFAGTQNATDAAREATRLGDAVLTAS